MKEECVWKGGREGVGAGGVVFGSNVRLVSGLQMRRSGFCECAVMLAMRDGNGRVYALCGEQQSEVRLSEHRVKWGGYWLAEVRTWRGMVRAVGGIRSREVSQIWWVSISRGKDECRRLAKAVLEKSWCLSVFMLSTLMSNFFACSLVIISVAFHKLVLGVMYQKKRGVFRLSHTGLAARWGSDGIAAKRTGMATAVLALWTGGGYLG